MWRQAFSAAFANIGSFYFGSSAAWSSPSMPHIVENSDYPFWVTKKQFGFIVAAMSFGAMLSTIPTGIIRHKYGTKKTMMVFAIPSTLGAILITIPQNISMLIFGRFLIGLTVGCYLFLIQIYVGEISSNRNRGSFLNFIHIFVHLGLIFVYTLGHFVSHRTLNIIYGSIPLFYAIGFQAISESPPFLASKGKFDKAERSLYSLRENRRVFESDRMALRMGENDEKVEEKKSFKELWKVKAVRRGAIIMCTQFFFFQMSGINAVNFYAQSIFMEAGMKEIHPGIASILYVTVLALCSISASVLARSVDRRVMICTFATLNAICLLIIGIYYNVKDKGYNVDDYRWVPLAALCANAVAFCHGTALVTWALLGELFTIEAKKVIAPFAQITSHFLTLIIVLSFPILVVSIGTGNIFYIFGACTFLNTIFAYFFIPETRGKSVQEIQEALEK